MRPTPQLCCADTQRACLRFSNSRLATFAGHVKTWLSEETEAAWATERPCLKKAKPQDKRDVEQRMQPSNQLVLPVHKTLALRWRLHAYTTRPAPCSHHPSPNASPPLSDLFAGRTVFLWPQCVDTTTRPPDQQRLLCVCSSVSSVRESDRAIVPPVLAQS